MQEDYKSNNPMSYDQEKLFDCTDQEKPRYDSDEQHFLLFSQCLLPFLSIP